jgi:hypothetical protein
MFGLFKNKVEDEMDFNNDVPPHRFEDKKDPPTINEQLNEIMYKIGRIEAKLDMMLND